MVHYDFFLYLEMLNLLGPKLQTYINVKLLICVVFYGAASPMKGWRSG